MNHFRQAPSKENELIFKNSIIYHNIKRKAPIYMQQWVKLVAISDLKKFCTSMGNQTLVSHIPCECHNHKITEDTLLCDIHSSKEVACPHVFGGQASHWPPIWNIGVFPKWNRNSLNSANLINHLNMNWSQFKDPVSNICLVGTVVASWSLTQGVTGWQVWALLLQW